MLLFVIGLLILGPERLPRVASQIGRWIGRARRTANQLRYQLEREIALADIEKKATSKKKRAADAPAEQSGDANANANANPNADSGEANTESGTSDSTVPEPASGDEAANLSPVAETPKTPETVEAAEAEQSDADTKRA
jgi:sec-independent protein translocase protein TatB